MYSDCWVVAMLYFTMKIHVTGMWLNVVQSPAHEQLYYSTLLGLFSTLTEVVDLQLEGKGHGMTGPCKIMIQSILKVCEGGYSF